MKSKYEILGWDTDFFGFGVAKINHFNNCRELKSLVKKIGKKNVKVAYVFLDQDDKERNICMGKNGAFLADEKTIYTISLDARVSEKISENIVEFRNEPVNDTLFDLAIQTSMYSRFRTDKNFGDDACNRLYKEWIIKSASGCYDDCVLVCKQNEKILGFITLKAHKDFGSIGLIGVDSDVRGNNIGSQLINKAISYFRNLGLSKIDVVTQKANIAACRFYEKNGFSISSVSNIYHLWI